jgi:SNF2 family DNA or RNA helicase
MRLVGRALTAPHGVFAGEVSLVEPLHDIAASFQRLGQRASGRPVVQPRLRLGLPDGDRPAWPLEFELADPDDPASACSARDIDRGTARAVALAGDRRWLPMLQRTVDEARQRLSAIAPWYADWAAGPGTVDTDTAAQILEQIDDLTAAGLQLLTPHQLARRSPRSAGTARPDVDGSGRFGARALVDWKVVVDGEQIDERALARASEAGATLVKVGGRWVRIGRNEARLALEQLARHRSEHADLSTLEVLRLSAELTAELEALSDDDDTSADQGDHPGRGGSDDGVPPLDGDGWLHDLLAGLPDTRLDEGTVPASFTATLRPYQRRGLGWLQFLHRVGLGGCLADDMGLGKTPTTLAHLAGLAGPHLVVCPLSVVRNWQTECERFTPFARVMVHHGTGRAAGAEFTSDVAGHDIVLTTYQVAARDIDLVRTVDWGVVVLDEAQAIKNPETRTAKAMRRVPARQHIALTGTPVENRLSELWSILDTVAPGLLGSLGQFRERFSIPIERHGDEAAAVALRQLTAAFLLRRTKADRTLVPDLPEKIEQIAWAPLTREQAAMYQAVVDQLLADAQATTGMKRRGLVLAALTRLKQICNHPAQALADGSALAHRSGKLARFDELVADLLDAGEQALVFTQFRQMGLLLQRHLIERFGHDRFGNEVPFLHGGVTKTGRDRMVEAFQSGTSASPLLIVSLKAGGTGLNLTAASRVVHYDRWWNPAVEDQATDRAWRIGQRQAVLVHKLVCQGTVEERVDALITHKRALAEAVVGTSGEQWLSELSTDELRDLVMLDRVASTGAQR